MTIEYKIENPQECFDEVCEMLQQHYEELSVTKGFKLNPDFDVYHQAIKKNVLKVVVCKKDNKIIGYILYLIGPNLHFKNCLLAIQDIYYLKPKYRKGFIGIKMFIFAENYLKSIGVNMIKYSTTTHFDNSKLFEFLGCNFIEKVYTKELK